MRAECVQAKVKVNESTVKVTLTKIESAMYSARVSRYLNPYGQESIRLVYKHSYMKSEFDRKMICHLAADDQLREAMAGEGPNRPGAAGGYACCTIDALADSIMVGQDKQDVQLQEEVA